MQIRISTYENSVTIDGEIVRMDLSGIAGDISIIHFDTEAESGVVEYFPRPPKKIVSLAEVVDSEKGERRFTEKLLQSIIAVHRAERAKEDPELTAKKEQARLAAPALAVIDESLAIDETRK